MTTAEFVEIKRLKHVARMAYTTLSMALDNADCGLAMLKEINPQVSRACNLYNEAMSRLSELDPNCPKWEKLC